MIDTEPTEDEDPDGHAAHALTPVAFEYVPAGHETHVLALVAPATPENAPAGHDAQTLAPVRFEYVPAEQFVHALAPASEYAPAAQARHTLSVLAPRMPEDFPTEQAMHALELVAPIAVEYAPAEHDTHALALLAPAAPEYVPATQFTHTADELAPTTTEYDPAEQFAHGALPVILLNVPATQDVQLPPSLPVYPMLHLHVEIDLFTFENGDCELAGHDWHLYSTDVIYNSGILQLAGLQAYGWSLIYVGY